MCIVRTAAGKICGRAPVGLDGAGKQHRAQIQRGEERFDAAKRKALIAEAGCEASAERARFITAMAMLQAQLKREKQALQAKVETLRGEAASLQSDVDKLDAERQKLDAERRKLHAERAEIEAERDAFRAMMREAEVELMARAREQLMTATGEEAAASMIDWCREQRLRRSERKRAQLDGKSTSKEPEADELELGEGF